MAKISVIETRVKEMLENSPATRENDNLLYVTYLEEYHYIDFNRETFANYERYGLPSFKSIERVRRKIQNEEGKYKASACIEEGRNETKKQFENYYRR